MLFCFRYKHIHSEKTSDRQHLQPVRKIIPQNHELASTKYGNWEKRITSSSWEFSLSLRITISELFCPEKEREREKSVSLSPALSYAYFIHNKLSSSMTSAESQGEQL